MQCLHQAIRMCLILKYSWCSGSHPDIVKFEYTLSQKKMCQLIFCFVFVKYEPISIKKLVGMSWKKHLTKQCKKYPLHLKYVVALSSENWSDWAVNTVLTCTFLWITEKLQKRLAVIVLKIVKRVISHIIFLTSCARNVCLQCQYKNIDAGATSPSARSMNSVIQTVHLFLTRCLSSSTSEILACDEGRHFKHLCKNNVTTCLMIFQTMTVSRVCGYSMIY